MVSSLYIDVTWTETQFPAPFKIFHLKLRLTSFHVFVIPLFFITCLSSYSQVCFPTAFSKEDDRFICCNVTSIQKQNNNRTVCILTPEFAWTVMAPHSSTFAWKVSWMEEPGRLQSMGSLRVGHDWVTSLWLFTFMHWRRKWQPTPVFLSGESQGQRSLVGGRLWGCTESDTTEVT